HHQDVTKHEQRWNTFWVDPRQNSWTNEFRFKKADGTYAYVEEIAYLIRDKEGKPIRMIGSVRDISDTKLARNRKQLEQNITQLFRSTRPLHKILQQVVDYLAQLGY
ncbi:PAS domain-containing protein, partial [Flavihumibacter sediminis]|nr:PAS domain-containing protein [Flavihumibacter sediminis]